MVFMKMQGGYMSNEDLKNYAKRKKFVNIRLQNILAYLNRSFLQCTESR